MGEWLEIMQGWNSEEKRASCNNGQVYLPHVPSQDNIAVYQSAHSVCICPSSCSYGSPGLHTRRSHSAGGVTSTHHIISFGFYSTLFSLLSLHFHLVHASRRSVSACDAWLLFIFQTLLCPLFIARFRLLLSLTHSCRTANGKHDILVHIHVVILISCPSWLPCLTRFLPGHNAWVTHQGNSFLFWD